MTEKNGTRETILENALRMFAENGYAAVSMRDIAGAAGIRASTIYYYFPGKQDILSELVRRADAVTEELKAIFLRAFREAGAVRLEPFVYAGRFFIEGYLRNDKIDPLLRVLENERFHNPEAEATWKKLLFTSPLAHEEKVFEALAERKEICAPDARALAEEYHGIIMMGYFTGDMELLERGLNAFYRRTFIERQGVDAV